MAEKKKQEMRYRNISVPKNFWSMPVEKQREFAKNLLMRFSPNDDIRKQSGK